MSSWNYCTASRFFPAPPFLCISGRVLRLAGRIGCLPQPACRCPTLPRLETYKRSANAFTGDCLVKSACRYALRSMGQGTRAFLSQRDNLSMPVAQIPKHLTGLQRRSIPAYCQRHPASLVFASNSRFARNLRCCPGPVEAVASPSRIRISSTLAPS